MNNNRNNRRRGNGGFGQFMEGVEVGDRVYRVGNNNNSLPNNRRNGGNSPYNSNYNLRPGERVPLWMRNNNNNRGAAAAGGGGNNATPLPNLPPNTREVQGAEVEGENVGAGAGAGVNIAGAWKKLKSLFGAESQANEKGQIQGQPAPWERAAATNNGTAWGGRRRTMKRRGSHKRRSVTNKRRSATNKRRSSKNKRSTTKRRGSHKRSTTKRRA